MKNINSAMESVVHVYSSIFTILMRIHRISLKITEITDFSVESEIRVLMFVAELCVLRTFGGVDFSLVFICAQSVSEFLWDRLRASIQFPVVPKRAQYARFSGETACLRRTL